MEQATSLGFHRIHGATDCSLDKEVPGISAEDAMLDPGMEKHGSLGPGGVEG